MCETYTIIIAKKLACAQFSFFPVILCLKGSLTNTHANTHTHTHTHTHPHREKESQAQRSTLNPQQTLDSVT